MILLLHDAGTYPACCGQVYGLKKERTRSRVDLDKDGRMQTHFPLYLLPASFDAYDVDLQMPWRNAANLLVMFLACYRFDGDINFFKKEYALAENWVEYLVKYGLKPENQLCTDDFAGHLKNNINLAIKATVGIAAYAELAAAAGKIETGGKYRKIAEESPRKFFLSAKSTIISRSRGIRTTTLFPSNTISPSTSF